MKLLKAFLGMSLERIVNPILRLDRDLDHILKPLAGKRLAVVVTDFKIRCVIEAQVDRLAFRVSDEAPADLELSAPLMDLMRLTFAEHPQPILAKSSVKVVGEVGVLQGFQRLAIQLDLDWEGHLSVLIGPVLAHEVGELARRAKTAAAWDVKNTQADISEYLTEESGLFPSPEAVEDFYEDVADLSAAVERLERKI